MYDMHYDLLTIIYYNMIDGNKFSNVEKLISDLKKIYSPNNILGGIVNLYFMTPIEMQEELDISLSEMENIKIMFRKSINFLNTLKNKNIIPLSTDFIYSIEGCDYIKDELELEQLYNWGLRSIVLVWNHQNKYGSGNRTNYGLTKEGVKLIKKAIELGMIIDVSHANEQTFNDILAVYKSIKKDDSIIIASHSNVRNICNRFRNLTDEQLIKLKNIGGYIGLFTNGNFLSSNNEELSYEQRQQYFLKHLDYIINKIKFDINKIVISTDDMNFTPNIAYHNSEAFDIASIGKTLFKVIKEQFGETIAIRIMKENAKDIFLRIKK